jgi:hypothetical protein
LPAITDLLIRIGGLHGWQWIVRSHVLVMRVY